MQNFMFSRWWILPAVLALSYDLFLLKSSSSYERIKNKQVTVLLSNQQARKQLVRDSSANRRLFSPPDLLEPWDVRELYIRKITDLPSNSGSAYFHVSWLFDFIFYQKLLYKLLNQSFCYSFITILPSESGVTLHYITIFPQSL